MNSIVSLAIAADLHVNSTVGLCLPSVNLDDGGTYHANRTQRWLWSCWLDFCQQAAAMPGRRVAILNGDLGELDTKRRSYQIITANKATISALMADVLAPLIAVVDAVYVMRGTQAHVGKSAWLEEKAADDITTIVRHDGTASWWHLRAVAAGVRLDVAHHGFTGGLPWTEKAGITRLAARMLWRYAIDFKQPPPHLVIRSHGHRTFDSYGAYETRAIITPAWTVATEYNYRAGHENDVADIGGLLITCEDGSYHYDKPILYRPREAQRLWTLKM